MYGCAVFGHVSCECWTRWTFILHCIFALSIDDRALGMDSIQIIRLSSSSQSMSSNNRLWPTAIWVLTTTLATTFEQMYFLHRYWTMWVYYLPFRHSPVLFLLTKTEYRSKNWIITCMLAVLILSNVRSYNLNTVSLWLTLGRVCGWTTEQFVFILVIDAAFIPTGNNSVVLQKLDAPL